MANDFRQQIHAKVVELAPQPGKDASNLRFDQEIPATGMLDSAAIMELILWLEGQCDFAIPQEDLENLGAMQAMPACVERGIGT